MFKRKKIDVEAIFGADLAARLVAHLGPEGAADFAKTLVADAKKRWSERLARGVSTEEVLPKAERERVIQEARAKGANPLDYLTARAAAATDAYVARAAKEVREEVAKAAVEAKSLPPELKVELAERLEGLLE